MHNFSTVTGMAQMESTVLLMVRILTTDIFNGISTLTFR